MDPRPGIIGERLSAVKNIIAVSGGKGGIGKSVIASAMALSLAHAGKRVGLLDLDFTCPSSHIILRISSPKFTEDSGIIPQKIHGIEYISVAQLAKGAVPMRGHDMTNAVIELLAVTIWGDLDYLIIDMPPGIGDAALDAIRLIKGIKFMIVTTQSVLALDAAKKTASLLIEAKIPIIGLIENMRADSSINAMNIADDLEIKYLGSIDYDMDLDASLGSRKFEESAFFKSVEEICRSL